MSDPFLDALDAKAGPQASDIGSLADAAERAHGLPTGIMRGLIHVESRGNPNAVSPQGALGVAQLLPATAKGLGVDPNDPAQAIDGAARYLKEGMDKTGSLDGGLKYYHGGPNQNIWGPKTQAYAGLVQNAAGADLGGGDPNAVKADPNDPFLAALDQVASGHGSITQSPAGQGAPDAGSSGSPSGPNPAGPAVVGGDGNWSRFGKFAASLDPLANSLVNGGSFTGGLQDAGAGLVHGAAAIPETMLHAAAGAIDATGYGAKTASALRGYSDAIDKATSNLASDPNSNIFGSRKLAGEVLSTLPVSEVKLLQAPGIAAKLAPALARYGDMAIQGAAASGAVSKGQDVGRSLAAGAVLAPAGGALVDALGPSVLKAIESAGGSRLAKALQGLKPAAVEAEAAPAASQSIARGNAPDLSQRFLDEKGNEFGGIDRNGRLVVDINGGSEPATSVPSSALGSRGARTGIESHTALDPKTGGIYAKLTSEGVSPEETLREADIRANGGNPTAATVTRNPAMMQAEKEGAKSASVEGQALNKQAADNNAALHTTAQGIVSDLGGAPAPGDAIQSAAESLQKASDTDRSAVRAAYKAADEQAAERAGATDSANQAAQDEHAKLVEELQAAAAEKAARRVSGGGSAGRAPTLPAPPSKTMAPGYINLSGVRDALGAPQLSNLTVKGGKTLRNGVLGLMKDFKRPGDNFTASEAEQIRQSIGQAYDPMGGGLNHHIGVLKAAVDKGMDEADGGEAYKAARALHKAWADKYENPDGVAKLISADTKGNLVNADAWRSAENMVGAKNDKPFLQIVKQLKANGDTSSLNKLKASIVQDAYEKATGRNAGTAADQLGNSTFSGSQFHARLNAIGMKKISALFEPDEVAKLASLGRAGVAVNEAVPGTVNTSHTASAVINALTRMNKAKPGGVSKAIGAALHAGSPILGAILHGGEGAGIGVGLDAARTAAGSAIDAAAQRRAANDLAEALRNLTSPQATRAADKAGAQKLADAMRRKAASRSAADFTVPTVAAANQGRR